MLQYNKSANNNSKALGAINSISSEVDFEIASRKIQKYVKEPLQKLRKQGCISGIDNQIYVKESFILQGDENGDIIWPKQVPLHFISSKALNWNVIIPATAYGTIDISAGDVSKVNSLEGEFYLENDIFCSKLIMDNGHTSQITNMGYAFYDFRYIKKLDFTTWDLSNVENYDSAFSFVPLLEEIKFNPNLHSTKNIVVKGMFAHSGRKYIVLNLRDVKLGHVVDAMGMFRQCEYKEIDIRGGDFDDNFTYNSFASDAEYLEIFNGVKLNRKWLTQTELENSDWTRICVDIIKHPENYETIK